MRHHTLVGLRFEKIAIGIGLWVLIGLQGEISLAETLGVTTVGTTSYPNDGLVNAGRILLPEDGFFVCGITNRAGTLGWFGTANYYNRSSVIKIDLTNLRKLETLVVDAPNFSLSSAVIDGDERFGYFLAASDPGRIIKIDLDSMTQVDSLTLPTGEEYPRSAFTNPAGTVAYLGAGEMASRVARIDLETFQRTGSVTLPITEPFLYAGVGDLSGQFGYFGSKTEGTPARVVKVDLQNMTRVGALEVPGVGSFRDGVIDPSGLLLYFCTSSEPAQLVRINLENFTEYTILTLPNGLNRAESLMINSAGTDALIGLQDGSVARANLLGNMTYESVSLPLGPATLQPMTAVRPQDSADVGYFAYASQPGFLTRHDIPSNSRLATFQLESDHRLYTAVVDHDGEYAYYGTKVPPARVVKVDLTRMERVASIILPENEQQILCSAIDGQDRYAYFGTLGGDPDNRAELVKVDLDTFTRVGAIQTNVGNPGIYSIALDDISGQAWITSFDETMGKRPVAAIVDLNSFQQVSGWTYLTLTTAEIAPAAVFNPIDNNVYFGTDDSPMKLFRASGDLTTIGEFNAPAGYNQCNELTLHPTTGNLYACTTGGSIIAFDTFLEAFTDKYAGSNLGPVYDGAFPPSGAFGLFVSQASSGSGRMAKVDPSLTLVPDPLILPTISDLFLKGIPGGEPKGLVLSPDGDRAWYGIYDILSFVGRVNLFPRDQVKATRVQLSTHAEVSKVSFYSHAAVGPTRSNATRLTRGIESIASGAFDRPGGLALIGTATYPGQIVKFDLAGMTQEATRLLDPGFDELQCAFMEPGGAHACFGTFTSPGRVARVRTSDLEVIDTLDLNPGEDNLVAAGVDPSGAHGYFAASSSPGKVTKVQLDGLSRVGGLTLGDGEDLPKCVAVDPTGVFAYVGCGTFPGKVVKVQLSDLTRVDAITLEPGEDSVRSAAIDPSGTFAYFGTDTSPARIVKVRLSDFTRVDERTLEPDESSAYAMAIDPTRERLVVALASFPAKVVVLNLSTFEREGAGLLREIENDVTPVLGLDAFGEYAYLGIGTSPGRVVRVELSPRPLRLGLYGNSGDQRTLLWESPPVPLSASETWIDIGIVEGNPTTLTLPPDEYWLAWQVDASTTAASYSMGNPDEGLCLYWPHGAFPEALIPDTDTAWTPNSDRWSAYFTYDEAPTFTPTAIPSDTPTRTPVPSHTSTATPSLTPSPTMEPVSSSTPTPLSTPATSPTRTPANYDIAPDPPDGKIDARDLIEWFSDIQDEAPTRDLLFDFSRFWQGGGQR